MVSKVGISAKQWIQREIRGIPWNREPPWKKVEVGGVALSFPGNYISMFFWERSWRRKMRGMRRAKREGSPNSSDESVPLAAPAGADTKQKQQQTTASGGMMGSLRLIELQLVAFILVFSASGLVPLLDLVFPGLTSAYILALAQFAFPSHETSSSNHVSSSKKACIPFISAELHDLPTINGRTKQNNCSLGDEHAVRSATPHLFLLSFQILMENIISSLSLFSPPVRALVPRIYTIRRIFIDIDWINDVWINKALPANAQVQLCG
ncbi:PREDICTED: uncharacterized protein LOC109341567 [Lupinus angustifolius]|uniref:uncharacterized protein LOC109341567 n=1 Tax=Lupinus angustifolius TaxID=3871 RepID=UPI00092FD885|nr:PREDICTED: uncharacterized protein LOC109341567 [Lupinus angustifolius]